MTIDGETQVSQSYLGACLTLLALVVTVLYSVQKIEILLNKKDVDVLSATKDIFYTDDDKFTYENGFNIAVAFTSYNDETEWELPAEYGRLVINSYSWGIGEGGAPFTARTELETHACSKEEMGSATGDDDDETDTDDE